MKSENQYFKKNEPFNKETATIKKNETEILDLKNTMTTTEIFTRDQ